MEQIQDSDFILYNALAERVISGLTKPLKIVTEKCASLAVKHAKLKAKFLESCTYDELGESSKQLKLVQMKLIKLLAIQDRIEKIVQRNKKRLELFKTRFDSAGIYNFQADKRELLNIISKEDKNVTVEALNLNPWANNDLRYVFFDGKILALKNGRLDFSIDENIEVLKESDASFIREIIETFPYSVGTIPDECYMSSKIKLNVLKESVLYVASKLKTQSIAESNKELGGLLANASEISNITEFAQELKNYLNVSVKKCFKDNSPDLASEIDENLRCNEVSEFLPRSKRVAVLANGLAADAPKTEVEESEEIRKEQEEEAQKSVTREELLELLLADDEEELEEQENLEETAKIAEEERKLNEEKQKELNIEELEKQLEMGLKKNDTVED